MDFQLRCNHLRCRERLKDKAVVTTCSHIFCLACSESSTLDSSDIVSRTCPACGTTLDKPFDVTVAVLRPTDDYKMSILAGLSPTVIMECANSGVAFWAYQSSQEVYYQEHANKSLKQQLDGKNQELNGVKAIARDEIGKLEEMLQETQDRIAKLSRSLAELEEGRKALERDRNKFRSSYEKLKQKALVPDIEIAAEENAAYAAQGGDFRGLHASHSRTGTIGSGGRRQGNDFFAAPSNIRNGSQSARDPQVHITPSAYGQQSQSSYGVRGSRLASGYVPAALNNHTGTPFRQPLGNLDQNAYATAATSGYNASGIKIGRQPVGYIHRAGMNSGRPMGGLNLR